MIQSHCSPCEPCLSDVLCLQQREEGGQVRTGKCSQPLLENVGQFEVSAGVDDELQVWNNITLPSHWHRNAACYSSRLEKKYSKIAEQAGSHHSFAVSHVTHHVNNIRGESEFYSIQPYSSPPYENFVLFRVPARSPLAAPFPQIN